jgi:ubiquinone/menaquinone biosynthesis C-methylase UbiE
LALAFCQFPRGAFLLDMGCGSGVTLEFLAQAGFQVLGLDKSESLIKLARLKGPAQLASFESLPLADQVADGLFSECVLSLAQDKALVLGEWRRVLKKGAFIVISDLLLKSPNLTPKPASSPLTCAAGALTSLALCQLLNDAGFRVQLAQDHGPLLKSLAASLLWRFGSLKKLAQLWPGACLGEFEAKNLTYGLIIGEAI